MDTDDQMDQKCITYGEDTNSIGEPGGACTGNTKDSACVNRGPLRHYWCFTWNNPIMEHMDTMYTLLKHECEWFVYQEETGEEGTHHIQGTLKFKQRKRLSAIKRLINNSIHWEPTRYVIASIEYARKEETQKVVLKELPWAVMMNLKKL